LIDHVDDAAGLLHALSATPAVVIGRSTSGQIALIWRIAFKEGESPGLLEPAVFSLDPRAASWALALRRRVLQAAAVNPSAAAEAVFREALGSQAWESLPEELQAMLAGTSPAVLAEIQGRGLDLSQQPLHLSGEELAGIAHPTLLVSSEDGPESCRLVNDRLADALPDTETALLTGGHVINPAHPAVLDFVGRILKPSGQVDR
jgi:pimeloyl-ACP methyl ester carboxylesterase